MVYLPVLHPLYCVCTIIATKTRHGNSLALPLAGQFRINQGMKISKALDTRAIYRIVNMDCPTEESLIRKKLDAMPGIIRLEFNLIQRVLTVTHALSSTEPIEAALTS